MNLFLAQLPTPLTAAMGLGLLLKVTWLVAMAGLLTVLLRRRAAAVRHYLWALSLWGSAALGLLTPFSPAISLPVPRLAATVLPNAIADHGRGVTTGGVFGESRVSLDRSVAGTTPHIAAGNDRTVVQLPIGPLVMTVWLVGTLALLGWLAIGHLGLARLARRAAPVNDPSWGDALRDAARDTGVARRIRLARSDAVGAPITWGLVHPIILLPPTADTWSLERRRVVLLHELAHVARGDFLLQLGGSIACALYWFHPVIWMAMRRLRNESERACDDIVLGRGTPAPDYAAHLLSVAQGSRALRLSGGVAIGMARRSALEGRLLAVLNETLRRGGLSLRSRRLSAAALGIAVIPLAGMRAVPSDIPAPRAEHAATILGTPSEQSGAPVESGGLADSLFERAVAASAGERLTIDLRPGGDVTVRGWDEGRVSVRGTLGGRDWRDERVELERDGDGVVLRVLADRDGSSRTTNAFDIRVPRRFDVRISSGGGAVSISGVEGTFRGTSGGGGLVLEHVQGTADLSTGGGDIRVIDSDLDGSVSTGGGLVRISGVRGSLRGSSGGGPVIYAEGAGGRNGRREREDIGAVRVDPSGGRVIDERREAQRERAREEPSKRERDLADERRAEREREAERRADRELEERDRRQQERQKEVAARTSEESESRRGEAVTREGRTVTRGENYTVMDRGALTIEKAGGDIELPEAPYGARIITGGGRIRVGRADGPLDVRTGGGNIVIGPSTGSVRAGTGAGTVEVTIVDGQGNARTIELTSGNGRMAVELPADFDGRFELETAYTRSYGRPTRIDSDWQLERETTTDWDDREGTPRRYVRARGSAGRGRGLISIRTVNGDIQIRRGR